MPQALGRLSDMAEVQNFNLRFLSYNVLAGDKVFDKGHAVVAWLM